MSAATTTATATFHLATSRADIHDAWPRIAPHVAEMAAAYSTDDSYTPDDLRDSLARGELWPLLMEVNGELAGFAVVHPMHFPRRRYLREAHLWVLPAYRGHGLFAQYLNYLRGWAVAHGYHGTTVVLLAADEPRWRPLMQAHGFTTRTVEYIWEAT